MNQVRVFAVALILLSGPALADLFKPTQQAIVCGSDPAAETAYVECSRARNVAALAKTPLSPAERAQCTAADAQWAVHITVLANCRK